MHSPSSVWYRHTMNTLAAQTHGFLTALPFFKGQEDKMLENFLRASELCEYSKHSLIFTAGDKAEKFYIIVEGWLKLFRVTAEGEESVLAMFTRGDVLGEAAVFEDATYPFSVEVAENAKLIEIPAAFLRNAAKENADVMKRIMTSMSREMHKLQLENEHLSIMTAPQRVGCLLLQLSTGMLGKGGTFTFPYDKSLAAARLGMKAETFSRALSQLKPFGVTIGGAEIKIDSFQCLVQYVCGHCSLQVGECRGATAFNIGSGCTGKSCCH